MSKAIGKMVKNKHVLVVGAGSNLKRYWKNIKEFIDKNDVVTVACNRINHILTPDVHFWADDTMYEKYGQEISEKSKVIFRKTFSKEFIRTHWDGDYDVIKYSIKLWMDRYDDPNDRRYQIGVLKYDSKLKRFYGNFRTMGSLSILWAHVNKASKISVVGMDGYSYFTKEELKSREGSQHCYGEGFTLAHSKSPSNFLHHVEANDKNSEAFYQKSVKEDKDVYRTLRSIKKYGAKFEILTPTVYKDFYNSNILEIKDSE